MPENPENTRKGLSRRHMLTAGGAACSRRPPRLPPASPPAPPPRTPARTRPADGTPEQIHLTWGNDPARSVVVSWASPGQATRPRVQIGERVIPAEERPYTDGLNGVTTYTYHARIHQLRPGKTYAYSRHRRQRRQRGRPVQRDVHHRAGRPGEVPVHQLRRPRHAQHRMGAVLRPVRVRGQRRRVVPAAVPPAQRRPVLRRPEPDEPARGLAGLRQQQPVLGGQPAMDARPRQPRDRIQQRPAGLHVLPDPVHAAVQRPRRGSRAAGTPSR